MKNSAQISVWFLTLVSLLFGLVTVVIGTTPQEPQARLTALNDKVTIAMDVVLDMADPNGDGRLSMSEIRAVLDTYNIEQPPGVPGPSQMIEYIWALSHIIDANGNGFIDPSELRRALSLLIRYAGDFSIGRLIQLSINLQTVSGNPSGYMRYFPNQSKAQVIFSIFDLNSDGSITREEMNGFAAFRRYRGYDRILQMDQYSEVTMLDGVISMAEMTGIVQRLEGEREHFLERLAVYKAIEVTADERIANLWANTL